MDSNIFPLIPQIAILFSIILFLILLLGSAAIILYYVVLNTFFNKNKENFFEDTLKQYGTWSIEKIQTRIGFIHKIVILEFFISLIVLIYLIWINQISFNLETLQFQNLITFFYDNVTYTLKCPISSCNLSSNISFSLEKFSIVIASLGAIVIYAHFFEMLGDGKDSKKFEETQSKYFSFFVNLWVFTAIYTLFAMMIAVIKIDYNFSRQLLPLAIGWINVVILMPLPYYYRKNFKNYRIIEKYNQIKFLDPNNAISAYIFILTLIIAYLGYTLNFDLLVLIFVEISLLLMYYWIRRFHNLPSKKCDIKFNGDLFFWRHPNYEIPSFLKDIYIIEENEDSITVILPNEENITRIMKSVIHEIIIPQNEEK